MPKYSCEFCNFNSKIKTHYHRHLKTSKHLKNSTTESFLLTIKTPKMNTNEHKRTQMNTNRKLIKCEYCEKTFNSHPSKRRHEIHYCKKSLDVIIKEKDKEKELLYTYIDKLIDQKGMTINIGKQTNNTQQNINLNSYGNEDLSHITSEFKTSLLKGPYAMIPKMIEAVHFNDKKPENMNITFPNKKENKIKIFSGDKWIYKNKDDVIDDLIDGNYFILDTHYENKCEPDNTYEKFQQLFDDKDKKLLDNLKIECEFTLLNNRD